MNLKSALITGFALAALAVPAIAQWRDDGHRGRAGPSNLPPPRVQTRMPVQQAPFRGPPQPQPRPGWTNDSLGAGWSPQQDEVRAGVTQRRFVPLGQAIEAIKRRDNGRELDAGLEQWAGRPAYRVRWAASNGRRIDYIVDAETGAILSADGGQ